MKYHDCIKNNCKKVEVNDGYYYYICENITSYNSNKALNKRKNRKTKTCKLCNKYPSFANKESSIPIYCYDHKLPDHINVRSKKCLYKNCMKQCTYGKIGTKAEYCFKHKPSIDYIDLRSRKCIICEIKRPSFGYNDGKPLYCFTHKPEDTYNVLRIKKEKKI